MKTLLLIAATAFLFSCGHSGSNGGAVGSARHLKLYLFGAPSCQGCDTELPQMEQVLRERLGDRYSHLAVRVYVLNGINNKRPTQQIADDYKAGFARAGQSVPFEFVPDPWIHKMYRHYYPDRQGQDTIPAAVVAGTDDNAVVAFTPGSVSPEQVANFINARLN